MSLPESNMIPIDDELHQLVMKARQFPPDHLEHQQCLTQMIRSIYHSQKLWHTNSPCYEDALQQTWIFFSQNICQAGTSEGYAFQTASVTTWLNQYLKQRLHDLHIAQQTQENRTSSSWNNGEIPTNPKSTTKLFNSSAPLPMLEEIREWVQSDPTGELKHTHVQNCADVTCQTLILRRLPLETPWDKLSAEFGIAVSTLGSFYQRQCMPQLKKLGESQE